MKSPYLPAFIPDFQYVDNTTKYHNKYFSFYDILWEFMVYVLAFLAFITFIRMLVK